MPPSLKKGIRFEKSKVSSKKYTAIMPDGKRVNFGAKNYEHYKDSVPVRLGGGVWKHKNHLDKERRKNYRTRHGGVLLKDGRKAVNVKYTPAWFSYNFLW
jgi:hypothetical protein